MTNLVLLSVSVVTNQIDGYWKNTTPPHIDGKPSKENPPSKWNSGAINAIYYVPNWEWVEARADVVTNYHFGLVKGTNKLELLVLKQP